MIITDIPLVMFWNLGNSNGDYAVPDKWYAIRYCCFLRFDTSDTSDFNIWTSIVVCIFLFDFTRHVLIPMSEINTGTLYIFCALLPPGTSMCGMRVTSSAQTCQRAIMAGRPLTPLHRKQVKVSFWILAKLNRNLHSSEKFMQIISYGK